ncbi:polysaccharide biosynthesis/export family protein [Pelagicoccus sp. SDUM812003]|uniref:polysaccharide biosynthesis/export family protein n=1 Tax=Pelagicoccus sp. SDUM812003 TaxID=3041267 RepID=UPI00280DEADF|nr:polysaccharide biosynthesis/export family protein [Pelagicoccus sp. SDUM812003]MDQ8203591.1 polysaccharide export protein [Pelagicoccus sp. SDUM812003]
MNNASKSLRIAAIAIACVLFGATIAFSQTKNYKLFSGDILRFTVYMEPDITTEARIETDGTFMLPFVGKVDAAGKTLSELQESLYVKYDGDYFINPQINLRIIEYAQRTVQVHGQVGNPGLVAIAPDAELTLMQAIAEAGGFTRRAEERKVQITRDGEIVNRLFRLNPDSLAKQDMDSSDAQFKLQPGDIVFVPESLF